MKNLFSILILCPASMENYFFTSGDNMELDNPKSKLNIFPKIADQFPNDFPPPICSFFYLLDFLFFEEMIKRNKILNKIDTLLYFHLQLLQKKLEQKHTLLKTWVQKLIMFLLEQIKKEEAMNLCST